MIRILIVDDSALMRKLLSGMFIAAGDFEVAVARDGLEAIREAKSFRPDVVTLDVNMPALDGLSCLDRLMVEYPVPVVMLSAITEQGAESTLRALELGAVDFVAKPEGVASLAMATITAELVGKVRAAAAVKLPRTRRLVERMRLIQSGPRPAAEPAAHRLATDKVITGLVLIGTSTGGPPALDILLSTLPAELPWPIVIAQHMPASFTRSLARRLNQISPLNVIEVVGPTLLSAGSAYIAHGGADILITTRAGRLYASSAPMHSDYPWHPSVDRLVRSALEVVSPADLIAILLTGMGSDGASSVADLRAAGGYSIAEAQETAVVWGMPGELVSRNGASEVVPLHDISRRLTELLT